MGFMGRLRRGISLTKNSLAVLVAHPKLMVFPLLAGAAALVFLAAFLGSVYGAIGIPTDEVTGLGILFVAYLVSTFLATFFTAALVHESRQVFAGNAPDLGRGVGAAWNVKGQLFVWALISATVGVILNLIQRSDSWIARILAGLFSVAWTVMTFFVVPVVVFERTSTVGMFSRSANTFKQTWGETGISLVGTKVVGLLIVLLVGGAAVGVFSATGLPSVAVALAVAGVVLAYLVVATAQGIIRTSLYVYATEGKTPAEFGEQDLARLNAE